MSIKDRFYSVSPIHDETSNFYKYIEAHEEELSILENEIDRIILSSQVNNATGSELDKIGKLFGDIGKRRGRDDEDYKTYLKNIVQSFRGRGTVPDIKFAVDNALFTGETDVNIIEYFGEYREEQEFFSSQSKGFLSKITVRDDKQYIDFYDEDDNTSLTVNFTTDLSNSLGTNEVNINKNTGEWKADESSDYTVTYDYREMLAYQVELLSENWQPHSSDALVNILDSSDASVSELLQPIRRLLGESQVKLSATPTKNRTTRNFESKVFISANDVSNQKVSEGLGTKQLDNNTIS
jgi:hypothetical protein